LPVQLNAIIYGILSFLTRYYKSKDHGNHSAKAHKYEELKELFRKNFQDVFWHTGDKWEGFRNYSLRTSDYGHILYGDLSAEIWPLYVGLATAEQAKTTKNNLEKYYKGDYGLATTSLELRDGGSLQSEPPGFSSFQWEYPNCWAPLMYIACEGLKKYGYKKEALEYEKNWVKYIERTYSETKTIPEKGPYQAGLVPNAGLYGLLTGFGWTISVYLSFLHDLSESELL
jgi:alpha,alpha-trehalase